MNLIYTAIFGGHAKLEPIENNFGLRVVCFTDDPSNQAQGWETIVRRPVFNHPRGDAKWYKMAPDLLFPNIDRSLWIDGSIKPQVDVKVLFDYCMANLNKGLAFHAHPERTDVIEEALVSAQMGKYKGEPIMAQAGTYVQRGLARNSGLWCGGVIARDHMSEWINEMGHMWMDECMKWSWQDQISLPYVLREFGLSPGTIPGSPYNHRLYSRTWSGSEK